MSAQTIDEGDVATEAEDLARKAAKATEAAAAARARADDAVRRAEERRQADVRAIQRRRLEKFPTADKANAAEERDAHARLVEAVGADTGVIAAYLGWRAAGMRRYLLAAEAKVAQQTCEPEASPIVTAPPPETTMADALQAILEQELAARRADFDDARQAELDQAGR